MKKTDIILSNGIHISAKEIEIRTTKSGGNGGQHVNKTETKVLLKWNILTSTSLRPREKRLLQMRLKHRISKEGTLLLYSSQTRSQQQNHKILMDRFRNLLIESLKPVKKRRPTKPTKGSIERRISKKKLRGQRKKERKFFGGE